MSATEHLDVNNATPAAAPTANTMAPSMAHDRSLSLSVVFVVLSCSAAGAFIFCTAFYFISRSMKHETEPKEWQRPKEQLNDEEMAKRASQKQRSSSYEIARLNDALHRSKPVSPSAPDAVTALSL